MSFIPLGTVVDSLLEHKPVFVVSYLIWMALVDRRPSNQRSGLAFQSGDCPSEQAVSETKQSGVVACVLVVGGCAWMMSYLGVTWLARVPLQLV
jgi:hypothetical protein